MKNFKSCGGFARMDSSVLHCIILQYDIRIWYNITMLRFTLIILVIAVVFTITSPPPHPSSHDPPPDSPHEPHYDTLFTPPSLSSSAPVSVTPTPTSITVTTPSCPSLSTSLTSSPQPQSHDSSHDSSSFTITSTPTKKRCFSTPVTTITSRPDYGKCCKQMALWVYDSCRMEKKRYLELKEEEKAVVDKGEYWVFHNSLYEIVPNNATKMPWGRKMFFQWNYKWANNRQRVSNVVKNYL